MMHIRREQPGAVATPPVSAAPPRPDLPPLVGEAGDAGPPGGSPDLRGVARRGVLWSAKVDAAGLVLDCIVLDISVRGARLRFGAPVALPDRIALRLRDGTRYEARRCWSRGAQVGVEFLGPGAALAPDAVVGRRAQAALEAVRAGDPATWLPALRAERFFGDEALRQAAEAAEVAHHRLLAALRPHAGA
jgi:hypothetical protein